MVRVIFVGSVVQTLCHIISCLSILGYKGEFFFVPKQIEERAESARVFAADFCRAYSICQTIPSS